MKLDAEDIERIADAVARRLIDCPSVSSREPRRLLDADAVARRLGVRRGWVYAHAEQLGAVRLGTGRGRLRFDPDTLPRRPTDREKPTPQPRRCTPGRGRRAAPVPESAGRPVRLLPFLVESRHTIEVAGRRANAPGPTPGG